MIGLERLLADAVADGRASVRDVDEVRRFARLLEGLGRLPVTVDRRGAVLTRESALLYAEFYADDDPKLAERYRVIAETPSLRPALELVAFDPNVEAG